MKMDLYTLKIAGIGLALDRGDPRDVDDGCSATGN